MAEQRERPLHELLSRDMVDIYVGEDNTHWTLHEKLLCHRSRFFRNVFYNKEGRKNHAFGLPDEDDAPFRLFVAWLYSAHVPPPKEEKDLAPLFDLYLMGEKWEIKTLILDVLEQVRKWYHDTDSWPGLRRVQYIYSNTEIESPMRQLMVSCVARMLVLGDGMPSHWDRALRNNGQLAVDVIMAVQKWKLEGEKVPDARDEPVKPILEASEEKKEANKANEGVKSEDDNEAQPDEQDAEQEDEDDAEGTEGDETAVEDHDDA